MVKKLLALFLVVLMSIESFGAVVSDNDGSAFITKAEFDSLKNSFQSQIDQYNTSIDNKIDSAIVSYLAGIKTEKQETKRLVFADWEKVTMFNSALENTWAPPNINLNIGQTSYIGAVGGWTTIYWVVGKLSYERGANIKGKRLLVDAGQENAAKDYATWIGRSLNLIDSIKLARNGFTTQSLTHIAYGGSMGIPANNKFYMVNATEVNEGYFQDLGGATTSIWNPKYYWDHGLGGGASSGIGNKEIESYISQSNAFTIDLDSVDGKSLEYEHILNWDNYTWSQVTDKDWTKSLRKMDGSSYTCQWMLEETVKDGSWCGQTTSVTSQGWRTTTTMSFGMLDDLAISGYYSGAYGNSDIEPFVGVGLVNKIYDSEHIYQSDTKFKSTVGSRTVEANQVNLYNGLPLLAAAKNEKITIDLEFDNGYRDGVSETDMEVDVFLAMEPFDVEGDVFDESKRIRCEGYPTTDDYFTTDERKIKLKWEMPSDGIVYIKWRPNDMTGSWQVDLNLEKNPNYIVEKDV